MAVNTQLTQHSKHLLGWVFVLLLLTGCGGSTSISQSEPTLVPTPLPTATPPTPTVRPTVTAAPTPDFSAVLPKAQTVCKEAASEGGARSVPALPVLTLRRHDNVSQKIDRDAWKHEELPSIEASSAQEVQTLVCIVEYPEKVGQYTDGSFGYRLSWNVRLVKWPEGRVMEETTFQGSAPPSTKTLDSSAAVYGTPPDEDAVLGWITSISLDKRPKS
jgi:hypothetical protein